jgi:hypothetical protein
MYPETTAIKSKRPSGSGDPVKKLTGHRASGFARDSEISIVWLYAKSIAEVPNHPERLKLARGQNLEEQIDDKNGCPRSRI